MIALMVGGRTSGRTTALLERMRELTVAGECTPVLICRSAEVAMTLYRRTFDQEGRPRPTWAASWQFVTRADLAVRRVGRLGYPDICWMVDDADHMLESLLGVPVALATWEGPSEAGAHWKVPKEHKGGTDVGVGMTGADKIAAERRRQVEEEGFTAAHDEHHGWADLLQAAHCYLFVAVVQLGDLAGDRAGIGPPEVWRAPRMRWPWEAEAWKPAPAPERNLIRAGALYQAHLDRVGSAASVDGHPSAQEVAAYREWCAGTLDRIAGAVT